MERLRPSLGAGQNQGPAQPAQRLQAAYSPCALLRVTEGWQTLLPQAGDPESQLSANSRCSVNAGGRQRQRSREGEGPQPPRAGPASQSVPLHPARALCPAPGGLSTSAFLALVLALALAVASAEIHSRRTAD